MHESPPIPNSMRRAAAPSSVYLLATAVLLALFAIFLLAPLIEWWAQPGPIRPGAFDRRMPLSAFFQQGAMNGFTVIWFFAVGASFGSFMNVVTWRMPRGMNFVSQSSICPKCKHAIRGRHNLPVIGWITLGGRCRDCGEPISFRYPLVEILFGGAAFILCTWELASGGWNFPLREVATRSGFYETLWTPQWDLIIAFTFHFCLFIWLLTLCLFEVDEEAAPRRFAIVAIVMVVAITYICPVVHPVSWLLTETAAAKPSPFAPERFSGLVGLLIGGLAALPAAMFTGDRRLYAINLVLAFALIGAHLGWHAALSTLVIANFFALLFKKESTSIALTALATLIQILSWRWLHFAEWELGILGISLWLLIAIIGLLVLPAIPRKAPR